MRTRRGASAVEFGLALPVLIYLALASVEYGWFLFVRTQAAHAAREGCRLGGTAQMSAVPSPATLASTRTLAVLDEYGFTLGDVTVTTAYSDLTGDAAGTSDTLTVRVDVQYQPIAAGFVPTPAGMTVSMAMMVQGAT